MIEDTKLDINNFKELVDSLNSNEISSKIGKELLDHLINEGGHIKDILNNKGIKQINDEGLLLNIIKDVINNNPSAIEDYKNGYDRAIKYLMGQVMKASNGQANPILVNQLLVKELSKYNLSN
jgi:aspartyl-tRNA(Asn)/glutamyl-tRNA(Gln) amidotransferase subunit B